MEQERPIPTERLRTVRDQMVERFSLSELRDLCFELGLNWDQLAGDTLDGKAIALLERLNRQARLPALLARLHVLHPDVAWELDDLDESAAPPYKGLAYYDRADARLFFGRERLIARLLASLRGLRQQSFLAVVGKSGSGKSSLVRAGLIPALRGERPPPEGADLPDGSPRWAYLEMTPTDRPLEQLAVTLTRDLTTAGETRAVRDDLQADPAAAPLYLRKYLERRRAPRALLLVDQFEELYAACKDEAARAAFITALLDVAEAGLTTVVITLRADFLHRFLDNARLRDALQRHQELIGAMDAAELREAVEQPALATGYELEAGLAEVIVGDTGQDAGALPLLSHALLETWRRREGWQLTHAGYNAAGGVGGAIARTAERAYADLDPAQQAIARRIFLELTELGEGAEDTRRSVALADLLPGDPTERAAAEAVLDGLYRARLVTADETQAQVTHEALIREWPALREWLKDEREALRLERRLRAAAEEWDGGGRDLSYLYDGAQLAAACQWAAHAPRVTGTVRAFLDAATVEEGREAAERERAQQEKLAQAQRLAEEADKRAEAEAGAARTFKRWATIAGILLVAAVAVAGVAVALRNQAVRATGDAQARLLQNSSAATFESDPLLANRLLLEGMVVGRSDNVRRDTTTALEKNLRTGQVKEPLSGGVIALTSILSGSVYLVERLSGNDSLLSSATGQVVSLSRDVKEIEPVEDGPLFFVKYWASSDELHQTDELRRSNDLTWVIRLRDHVRNVTPVGESRLIVVEYADWVKELLYADMGQTIPFSGDLAHVIALESPFFVITYSGKPAELRRTNDLSWVAPLGREPSYVFPLPGSPIFVVDYTNAQGELRDIDTDKVITLTDDVEQVIPLSDNSFFVKYTTGRSELRRTDTDEFTTLNDSVLTVHPITGSDYYVVRYQNGLSELHHINTNKIVKLGDDIHDVSTFPDSSHFVIRYLEAPYEVRSTVTGEVIVVLDGGRGLVTPVPDSPFFVVSYDYAPSELGRTDTEVIVKLSGYVTDVAPFPDSSFFVLSYAGELSELRRKDSGEVMTHGMDENGLGGLRGARTVDLLDASDDLYTIHFQDGSGTVFRDSRALVDLGRGVEQSLYFPETNRVAVRYGDGRVVYIDMNLIDALGGADAAKKLDAMSPEELIAFTCKTLFTDNPEWDETKLEAYLADSLPEWDAKACGE